MVKTLGWFCKENGTTLNEVVEVSDVQKGTLESRWRLGKKKEILCIIEGCKVAMSKDDICPECNENGFVPMTWYCKKCGYDS